MIRFFQTLPILKDIDIIAQNIHKVKGQRNFFAALPEKTAVNKLLCNMLKNPLTFR
jgi:hypothetical protein